MKPKLLRRIVLLLCVFNLTGFLAIEPRLGSLGIQAVTVSLLMGLAFYVLWKFWLGRWWARVLVIIASCMALLQIPVLGYAPIGERIVIILEAPVACFLLYWLNTIEVKEYFARTHRSRKPSTTA
jgi:hypothetical protein